jgi:AraC-like DNA-binding protein
MIFNFHARVRERKAGHSEWAEYQSFTSGLHDAFTITESAGSNLGVQVNFTALGARLFFGLPLDAIVNRSVPIAEIAGASRDVEARLYDASTWSQRFEVLDREIAARIAAARPIGRELAWAWQQLTRSSGRARIARIVREVGWSERHLATRFRSEFGLAPKAFARVLRFQHAVRALSHPTGNLADVAVACGYYDQAHFNRDFQQFAGVTPLALLASRSSSDPGFDAA